MTTSPQKTPNSEVLFFINLELQDGNRLKTDFCKGDSPEELAYKVCNKNKLSLEAFKFMVRTIEAELTKYQKKQDYFHCKSKTSLSLKTEETESGKKFYNKSSTKRIEESAGKEYMDGLSRSYINEDSAKKIGLNSSQKGSTKKKQIEEKKDHRVPTLKIGAKETEKPSNRQMENGENLEKKKTEIAGVKKERQSPSKETEQKHVRTHQKNDRVQVPKLSMQNQSGSKKGHTQSMSLNLSMFETPKKDEKINKLETVKKETRMPPVRLEENEYGDIVSSETQYMIQRDIEVKKRVREILGDEESSLSNQIKEDPILNENEPPVSFSRDLSSHWGKKHDFTEERYSERDEQGWDPDAVLEEGRGKYGLSKEAEGSREKGKDGGLQEGWRDEISFSEKKGRGSGPQESESKESKQGKDRRKDHERQEEARRVSKEGSGERTHDRPTKKEASWVPPEKRSNSPHLSISQYDFKPRIDRISEKINEEKLKLFEDQQVDRMNQKLLAAARTNQLNASMNEVFFPKTRLSNPQSRVSLAASHQTRSPIRRGPVTPDKSSKSPSFLQRDSSLISISSYVGRVTAV
jgi:hypothetical protein